MICRLQESTLGIPYEPGTAQADAYSTEQDEGELIWRALRETDAQFGNSRADHGDRAAKKNTLFFQRYTVFCKGYRN